ncbi:MAG: polysaccharide biosynthesis C-terminal domain-containing protein [Acidimicrobiia bacterium]|nr:polysaccharide biosynthesis C-terminal domain-containing protein [Acidimicrobiia bacterium]
MEGAERAFVEAVRVLYVIGFALSAGLAVLADATVSIVLGGRYGGVAGPFRVLAAGQFLQFTIFIQMALVNSTESPRRGIAPAFFVAGITVAADAALIPPFGASGAAAALVISWAVGIIVYGTFLRRLIGIRTPLPSPGMLAAVGALIAAALPLRHDTALAVVAGGAAYVIVLLLTRVVTLNDVARLRSAVAARRGR